MEVLLSWDKALFLWLNGLGSETFDGFWMMMTHRASNILDYLIILGFIGYKNSWTLAGYILFFTGLLILCTGNMNNHVYVKIQHIQHG